MLKQCSDKDMCLLKLVSYGLVSPCSIFFNSFCKLTNYLFSACVVSCQCRLFLSGVGSGDVGSGGVGSGDVRSGGRKIGMFVSDVSARGSVSDIMNKRCKRRVKIDVHYILLITST